MWPCPRTRQELITHPSKPSESRIDTLKEPWIENELNGGSQEAEASDAGGPANLSWRKEFDTVPSNGKAVFGGLKVKRDRNLNQVVCSSSAVGVNAVLGRPSVSIRFRRYALLRQARHYRTEILV